LTSTLRPTLLNEFRFGLSRTLAEIADPMVADREGLTAVLHQLMPTSEEYPVVIEYDSLGFSPGYNFFNMFGGSGVSHPYGSMGVQGGSWGGKDHRWTVSDTMTWMRGAHSFKGGVEVRLSKSLQESNSQAGSLVATSMYPAVLGGAMSTSSYDNTEFDSWTADGLTQGNSGTLTNLLSWYAGSVQEIQQYFYTASAENRTWNDLLAGERLQVTDLRNREFAFFFKDDWKVNSSLTLNLGVRYEYYGVPWEESGMSVALVGGSQSLWGPYGGDFDTWMPADPSALTYGGDDRRAAYQFVGPNSPNSDLSPWNKDTNNFAPHVGFSWQLPWLGKGKTTLRGGYSISYSPIANFDGFGTVMSRVPGTEYRYTYGSTPDYPYLNLNDIKNAQATGLLPLAPPASIQPLSVRSLYERSQSLSVYDDDIQNPYVQNLNLSLTRQIGNAFTVDVRYIGTLSRKQLGGINLNAPNFVSNGLAQEFDLIRAGEQSEVINSLIPSGALWYGPPGATGSDQVRTYDIFFSNMHIGTAWDLMQGNYSSLANQLATANGIAGAESGVAGALLRGGLWNGEQTPENLIYASPQFSSATLNSNLAHSNYHSLQAQVTMRPLRGLSFQNTYTWSRNLTDQGMTDYLSGNRRYYLASQHRSHTLNSYGSFDLPMGANGFLFRDASGAFKKAIEGWQLSWIASLTSGIPGSITGASRMWGDTAPVLVRPDLWDSKAGEVTWEEGALNGYFFGDRYIRGVDPQCYDLAGASPDGLHASGSLAALCAGSGGLRALYLRNPDGSQGDLVMRNARPGEVGNFAPNELTGPGRWSLDMAMSKSVEFMEGKKLEVRVDAQNIFNHPTPSNSAFRWNARFTQIGNPDFALNPGVNADNPYGFGLLSTKGGHRTFQAKIRLSF
jgi:hypothetical protein